ncbi:MAG: hypothetical protein [Bacteriophage sp.]|nr:MAG: hypothetical protein [Bacteriophage sp.]
MASEPKLRPSFSVRELSLIAQCVEFKLNEHIKAGDFSNPVNLQLDKLKQYCLSFCGSNLTEEQLYAKFLALHGKQLTHIGESTAHNQQLVDAAAEPELTNEQKYDLLKLRNPATYTPEENAFYLNVGTGIELARMSKRAIGDSDL